MIKPLNHRQYNIDNLKILMYILTTKKQSFGRINTA